MREARRACCSRGVRGCAAHRLRSRSETSAAARDGMVAVEGGRGQGWAGGERAGREKVRGARCRAAGGVRTRGARDLKWKASGWCVGKVELAGALMDACVMGYVAELG